MKELTHLLKWIIIKIKLQKIQKRRNKPKTTFEKEKTKKNDKIANKIKMWSNKIEFKQQIYVW